MCQDDTTSEKSIIFALPFGETCLTARMVKLVDTLVSGTSGRKAVQVRVLFRAQKRSESRDSDLFCAMGTLSEAGLEVEGAAEAGGDADEAADVADGAYADARAD